MSEVSVHRNEKIYMPADGKIKKTKTSPVSGLAFKWLLKSYTGK